MPLDALIGEVIAALKTDAARLDLAGMRASSQPNETA
jgi:hypothetical protein